jgi:hypothetical protein
MFRDRTHITLKLIKLAELRSYFVSPCGRLVNAEAFNDLHELHKMAASFFSTVPTV